MSSNYIIFLFLFCHPNSLEFWSFNEPPCTQSCDNIYLFLSPARIYQSVDTFIESRKRASRCLINNSPAILLVGQIDIWLNAFHYRRHNHMLYLHPNRISRRYSISKATIYLVCVHSMFSLQGILLASHSITSCSRNHRSVTLHCIYLLCRNSSTLTINWRT